MGETMESETPKCYFPRRFNVVALSFIAITLAYMMRSNLSIAVLVMSTDFNWPLSSKGMFLSSFFWGYITTQLVGGMAARRFGPKNTLLFVIVVPSIFTMFIPLVAPHSEALFVLCRVLTGVAAGATFPTMYLMLAGWLPFSEKATCLAIVFSGTNIGTILIDTIGPKIMSALGWEYVFYFSGGVGFIWMIFWYFTVADNPQQMNNIHPSEREYIMSSSEQTPLINGSKATIKISDSNDLPDGQDGAEEKPTDINKLEAASSGGGDDSRAVLLILMRHASFWNIVFCGFCVNWGSYIFLTWLPTYVHTELGFSLQWSGIIAITPCISNTCVAFASGKLCDSLLCRGYNKLIVRKAFFSIGCLLYIATLFLLAFRKELNISDQMSAIILALGTGGTGLHLPGYTANTYDIAPNHPSLVIGISNTAGTIPGIVGVYLTGILLQAGFGWGTIWMMTASFYVMAMVSSLIFANVKRIL